MRTFQFSDAKSDKFWSIELAGTCVTVRYGRVGTKGQTRTKEFATELQAAAAHANLIKEKLSKCYVEIVEPDSKLAAVDIAALADALALFGFSPAEAENFRNATHEDPLWDFNDLIQESPSSVYSDWKEDAASVFMELGQRLRTFHIRASFGKAKGFMTAEISHAGNSAQYVLNVKKPGSLTNMVFALDAVLPDHVEIYAHKLLDETDMAAHTALTKQAWNKVRVLLGPHFERVFSKPRSSASFVPEAPPPVTKVDWKKKFGPGNLSQPLDQWNRDYQAQLAKQWEEYVSQGPTPVRNRHLPAYEVKNRIQQFGSDAMRAWIVNGDKSNLATALYQCSMLARVGVQWDLFQWKGLNPSRESTAVIGDGFLLWAYFVFTALGCESEARTTGDLLLEPNVNDKERWPSKLRQDSWYDLAVYMHTGRRGKGLPILADLMELEDRAAWLDGAVIDRALQCHVVGSGDQFVHDHLRWFWPAPLYALARRAGAVDLLPADNPFLNTPLDVSGVNFADPQLVFLRTQHADFGKLERSQFPGLVGITQAEYDQAVREASKGKKGKVTPCRCGSAYLVRKMERDTPNSGEIRCEKCGEMVVGWSGPIEYEVELLVLRIRKGQ
jgi:predicted DNA-binding WGR domain protein